MSPHDDDEGDEEDEWKTTVDALVRGFVFFTKPTRMQESQVRFYLAGLAVENDIARHLITKHALRNKSARELLETLGLIRLGGEPHYTSARRATRILQAATPHD